MYRNYIFYVSGGLILRVLLWDDLRIHWLIFLNLGKIRGGWMINGVEVLLPGHLKRILSAVCVISPDYKVITTVRWVSRNTLSTVKGLGTPIFFLNLVYEMELFRITVFIFLLE